MLVPGVDAPPPARAHLLFFVDSFTVVFGLRLTAIWGTKRPVTALRPLLLPLDLPVISIPPVRSSGPHMLR